MLEQKKIDLKPLISNIYNVEDVLEAFEDNKRKSSVKILVKF